MVRKERMRRLNSQNYSGGEIVYWMSRDMRVHDNWALLYAQELSLQYKVPLRVVFCLRSEFGYATERLINFMLGGLLEVEKELAKYNIHFNFLIGEPTEEIIKFCEAYKVGAVVSDFSPLKYNRKWKEVLSGSLECPFFEVDAHNIVPAWVVSQKQEYGAYTLRPKIKKLLPVFLEDFPALVVQDAPIVRDQIDWNSVSRKIKKDTFVKKVANIAPGENEAWKIFETFSESKLPEYAVVRNDPTVDGTSMLSPYFHFGHISAQRIAFELERVGATSSTQPFLEELIVRKELSDNYCLYSNNYDNDKGFPEWARVSLEKHSRDPREHIYSFKELENAETQDPLWNAAQKQMVVTGRMHGYMRMYWAKKILEWTRSPQEAQEYALKLNDTYFLDGRDPNGYTGIAWAIGGVHDRPWVERPIFGKVRYMNFNGAKRKFNIDAYIKKVDAF